MWKLAFPIAATFLAGCASLGQWRDLSVDGSSPAAFDESLSRLNEELPYARRKMFSLALVDIARTGARTAGARDDGRLEYTDEDLRAELDGLTYEGVIALADQSGPRISTLYYSRGWAAASSQANLLGAGSHPVGASPPSLPVIESNGSISWPNQ